MDCKPMLNFNGTMTGNEIQFFLLLMYFMIHKILNLVFHHIVAS